MALVPIGGCGSSRGATSRSPVRDWTSVCSSDSFVASPAEHLIVELHEPIVVAAVEGVITSQAGEWPEQATILIELRPADFPGVARRAQADGHGKFRVDNVKPGRYCFKATAIGWQSVIGIIVVSKDVDPEKRVAIELPLGV